MSRPRHSAPAAAPERRSACSTRCAATDPMRVTELVALTGLSRPTVDAVADDLRAARLAARSVDVESGRRRGRPARRLAFRADAGYVVGVDIGEEQGARGGGRPARRDRRRARARVRRARTACAVDPPARSRATLKDAGVRRDSCWRRASAAPARWTPTRARALQQRLPGRVRPRRRAGAARSARPVRGRERLQPRRDRRALARRRARAATTSSACSPASGWAPGIIVGGRLVRGHAGAAGEMAFLGAYEAEHGARGDRRSSYAQLSAARRRQAVFDRRRRAATRPRCRACVERGRALGRRAGSSTDRARSLNPEVVVIGGGVARGRRGAARAAAPPARRAWYGCPPALEASPLAERGPLLGAIRLALDDLEPRLLDGLEDAA